MTDKQTQTEDPRPTCEKTYQRVFLTKVKTGTRVEERTNEDGETEEVTVDVFGPKRVWVTFVCGRHVGPGRSLCDRHAKQLTKQRRRRGTNGKYRRRKAARSARARIEARRAAREVLAEEAA